MTSLRTASRSLLPVFLLSASALLVSSGDASAVCETYHPLTSCRLIDTRTASAPALAPGTARIFTVAGSCGIPVGATRVDLVVTAFNTPATDFVLHFKVPAPVPVFLARPAMECPAGTTPGDCAERAVAALDGLGRLKVKLAGSDPTQLIVDVCGYFD